MKGRVTSSERTDCFVDTENQTACFNSRLYRIHLHKARLPHKSGQVISNTFVVKVNPCPGVAFAVLDSQSRKDIGRIKAGVVAELTWDNLKRFGERLDDCLLLSWNVLVCKSMEIS